MTNPLRPTTKRGWQRLIDELGLRPSKGRGQNFLHDISVVHQIVKTAEIAPNDRILEIGPGLGMLTGELLARAGRVTAIELDPMLADHIERAFASEPTLTLVRGDALQVDLAEVTNRLPVKVVANLPYSAGAAILQAILESGMLLTSATLMLQLEVAERIVAEPPNMSILSIATQLHATGVIAFIVAPDVFLPPPTVESAVIHLVPRSEALLDQSERQAFFWLVNAGFRHKRKNIANSLEIESRKPKAELAELLRHVDIDPTRRAQTLSVEEWVTLHHAWSNAYG